MPLSFSEQYDVLNSALATGDIDLLSKIITDPSSVTVNEQRTVAEKLGLKGGFLAAAVNTVADPTVWLATLMSRKFPTHAWLTNKIPHRLIGTAAEFSGISLALRPTEGLFRGTNISNLVSLSQYRHAQVMETAQRRIFDVMRRPNWNEEMPIVSLALEGVNSPSLTPELVGVTDKLRSGMNEMWQFLGKTKKLRGGLDVDQRVRSEDFSPTEAPKFLRDYLPHIPLTGKESTFEISGNEAMQRLFGSRNRSNKQLNQLTRDTAGVTHPWQPDRMRNQDTLVSQFHDFQRWVGNSGAQVYNPHLFRRVRHGLQLQSPKGQELWHTDLNLVLQKYASSVARSYSLNAPLTPFERAITSSAIAGSNLRRPVSDEPIIAQIINEGLDVSGVQFRTAVIKGEAGGAGRRDIPIQQVIRSSGSQPMLKSLDTLVRSVRGNSSEDEILFGKMFGHMFDKIDKLRGRLPENEVNQLTGAVDALQRNRSVRQKMDAITNYFYTSTLGLNFSSVFKNTLQPILTTAPAIGLGHTLAGIREFAPKVRAFSADLAAQSRQLPADRKFMPHAVELANRTFAKHFPELVQHRLEADPRLYDIDESNLKRMSPDGKFIDKEAFFSFLMAPFTASEVSNRAITFYGAKSALRHHTRTGEFSLPKKPDGSSLTNLEANEFYNFEAANIVNATQFRPGPGSRTVLQSMLPSPIRQFSTFPLRLGNFFAESTVRGAMTQAQIQESRNLKTLLSDPITGVNAFLGGRNLGTVARTYLYGKIAANGLREVLGVDISGATGLTLPFTGALDGQPFSPLPIPPLPSAIFGSISALANRDVQKLQPLDLPGGIKIPIPKTLFPGGVAVSRLFRAWNQFRPDLGGFVDENERLKVQGDTMDLTLAMLGIPMDKARRERQILGRLHDNRGVLRQFGRDYRLAASNFDFDKMDQLRAQHQQRFPDMPQLSASDRDLARFDSARRVTRVQRMLQTLPGKFRTVEQDIYDVDSDLIAQPQLQPLGLGGFN